MLKLEKIARTRDVSISLRDKPANFNKTFFIALGYALTFHFTAFCFIQISGFKMGYQESIYIPAFVAADLQNAVNMRSMQIAKEDESFPLHSPPLPTLPRMLEPWNSAYQPLSPLYQSLLPQEEPKANLGTAGIAHYEESAFDDLPPISPVKVTISGALADCRLLRRDLHEEALTRLVLENKVTNLSTPRHFFFHVHVDERGEVFFWESLQRTGEEICSEHALHILKSMRFAIPRSSFTVKGDIEISLHLSQLNWQPSSMDAL